MKIKLADDWSNYDLFLSEIEKRNFLELWDEFQENLGIGLNYEELYTYVDLFEPYGLIFDYGLDAEPYDFELI